MESLKIDRIIGMTVFTAAVLILLWYWNIDGMRWTNSDGQGSIIYGIGRMVTDSWVEQRAFWRLSRFAVPIMSWITRAPSGRLMAWVYRKV